MLERNGPPEDRLRECAIANAPGVLGDRWSLLVLREIDLGVHRFTEMKRKTGAPSDILAARLRKLESFGVIERHRYSERPPRGGPTSRTETRVELDDR